MTGYFVGTTAQRYARRNTDFNAKSGSAGEQACEAVKKRGGVNGNEGAEKRPQPGWSADKLSGRDARRTLIH
jgi:hypothetical protein